jgi:hypothetical protein
MAKEYCEWTHDVGGVVTTRDDIVPHWTINYVRRMNAEDAERHGKGTHERDIYRTARAFNAGRHHPRSSWRRWMRTRWS